MRPKLVLFGDSITEESFGDGGWGATLAHHLSRTADVVLRGYGGYNTRWARMVLERAMDGVATATGGSPLAVTVFFGANDASLPDRSCGFQHVPLPEYGDNLRAICSSLKEMWPNTVVILITPPPIDEDGRLQYPYGDNSSGLPERTNESAGAYAKACIAVAKESGIPVIDLWSKMQQFPGWEKSFLSYGDMPAHNLLWRECAKSAGDVAARLAVIPLVQEARGLDAGPRLVQKLIGFGDHRTSSIVAKIADEEVAHVAVGVFWFVLVCQKINRIPCSTFKDLLKEYDVEIKGPFNYSARAEAGIPRNWYDGSSTYVANSELSEVHDRLACIIAMEKENSSINN